MRYSFSSFITGGCINQLHRGEALTMCGLLGIRKR